MIESGIEKETGRQTDSTNTVTLAAHAHGLMTHDAISLIVYLTP